MPPSALAEFDIFDFSVKEYNTGEDLGFRQAAQGLSVAGRGSAPSLGCVCWCRAVAAASTVPQANALPGQTALFDPSPSGPFFAQL